MVIVQIPAEDMVTPVPIVTSPLSRAIPILSVVKVVPQQIESLLFAPL